MPPKTGTTGYHRYLMEYLMLRTFDHSGYYETRLILMAISATLAVYTLYSRKDRRYLIVFLSGVLLTTISELVLQRYGLRGPGYGISIFGVSMPKAAVPAIQGLIDGGSWALIPFWFADLRSSEADLKRWIPFWLVAALTLGLSVIAGQIAKNEPVSSTRPLFETGVISAITTIIFVSFIISWRRDGISQMAGYYAGLLIFAALTLLPLHLSGSAYIGIRSGLQVSHAGTLYQAGLSTLSIIFESAGGRLHFFIIPFAFTLVRLRTPKDDQPVERYSIQHLQTLAQRGWRKRSKAFRSKPF